MSDAVTVPDKIETLIAQSASILARSLFVIMCLIALIFVVSAVIIVNSYSLQVASLLGYGLGGVLLVLILRYLLRKPPEELTPRTTGIVRIFSNPIMNGIITLVVVEGILFLVQFTQRFLGGESAIEIKLIPLWSIPFAIIWLIVSYPLLYRLTNHPIWKLSTLSVVCALIVYLLVQGNHSLFKWVDDEQNIQVAINQYFLGETLQEQRESFWREYFALRRPYKPYLGHRSQPFAGKFMNVDENGIRRTVQGDEVINNPDAISIYFFGGSAVWGYGARDEYTIPSETGRILDEIYDIPTVITNFAEVGYSTMQDKLTFDFQVLQGNIPDVAVFYHGYNDFVLGSIHTGYIGANPNDLKIASIPFPDVDTIFDYYVRYIDMMQVVAEALNVKLLLIWQPSWVYKPLTEYELYQVTIVNPTHTDQMRSYYQTFDKRLQDYIVENEIKNVYVFSDFFQNEEETIFMDTVHLTELGNTLVSEDIAQKIVDLINEED